MYIVQFIATKDCSPIFEKSGVGLESLIKPGPLEQTTRARVLLTFLKGAGRGES